MMWVSLKRISRVSLWACCVGLDDVGGPEEDLTGVIVACCVGSDDVGGPEEDLTGVVVDEDTAALELELALSKARRLTQSKSIRRQQERHVVVAQADDTDTPAQFSSSIELNSTSEFCRSLGEIPTLGIAGIREDDDDEMMVCRFYFDFQMHVICNTKEFLK